jgi:hypothetical protein
VLQQTRNPDGQHMFSPQQTPGQHLPASQQLGESLSQQLPVLPQHLCCRQQLTNPPPAGPHSFPSSQPGGRVLSARNCFSVAGTGGIPPATGGSHVSDAFARSGARNSNAPVPVPPMSSLIACRLGMGLPTRRQKSSNRRLMRRLALV